MITIDEIKSDLSDIRCYYENQSEFDLAAKTIGESAASCKAKIYNSAIVEAPARLYLLYMNLYIDGNTQQDHALNIDRSPCNVCKLNLKLCRFFLEYFAHNAEKHKTL